MWFDKVRMEVGSPISFHTLLAFTASMESPVFNFSFFFIKVKSIFYKST